MKKEYILLLIAVVFVLSGCSKVIIPEVSPTLSHKELMGLTEKNLANVMMKNSSQLIFVNLDGEFFRWDPKEQIINSLVHINSPIDPKIFTQDEYVCFKELKSGKYTIFDLNDMKVINTLEDTTIQQIIGLGHDLVIYLSKPKNLIIYDYRNKKQLVNLKFKGKQEFYNVEFSGDNVFILSDILLYKYSRGNKHLDEKQLQYKANSGFLLDGNVIYYGSQQREFVKLSVNSNKPSWSFKLADELKIKPQKIGNYIVIIPVDNNIYFFKKSGTLYWWEKLNSTRLYSPVMLKENAAVYLWDKNVKFFNYKNKQITTYPLDSLIRTNPQAIDEYLYVVTEEKIEESDSGDEVISFLNLTRIGNHYGIEITTNPRYAKPLGKSVRFDLKSMNLIKPSFSVKILKNIADDHSVVYEKILQPTDKPSFVWIPKEPIEYRLIIEINAENKKGIIVEQDFPALDIQHILGNYYYEMQSECERNTLN